jgi:hypothetical protein
MRNVLVACAFLASSVGAADFRVVNFGDSCDSVRALEKALGSREASWPGLSPDVPAFTGRAFDREVTISYFCVRGKFAVGNYFFPVQSLDDAVESLHEAYDSLNSTYGAPYTDATPWHGANSRFITVAPEPSKYTAYWRGERANTIISLRPGGDPSGTKWKVAIAISQTAN